MKVLSLLSFVPWNFFGLPCTPCVLGISNNSVWRIFLKIKCFSPTWCSPTLVLQILLASWCCAHLAPGLSFSGSLSELLAKSIQDSVNALLAFKMHTLHTSIRRETIETHPTSSRTHTVNLLNNHTWTKQLNHTHINQHSFNHTWNEHSPRIWGNFCLFYSFMRNKLHSVSTNLLYSTDLSYNTYPYWSITM
jgi:hypothetical protein